ncbi:urate hydroxylase PuuD [Novosphingobium sp. G106]|uniref:urate hydroxylase PuuD n=1 Tax=Novosphingobium sp. G106 TaxID=2849500 RepID=UPI001C2D645D|nr:urate hydroxylase PuuD [Novosphingobium sp. G106]MBV1687631.1 urate hydroxylase PuuD [Novosphingobium sp. G106]
MAKLFGNLHLVLAIGLVLAIAVMMAFAPSAPVDVNSVFRWLHLFFGVLWIGLLYYLNFVQVPTMPKVPAELKKGVTGYIAPNVFFFFRWAALFTVLTGLTIAFVDGYGHQALTFTGEGNVNLIGLGMWIAIVMFLNVWLIIWPAQKKILGIIEATDEEKAKATPRALIASRTNLLLSLPMFYCMVSANLG